MILVKVISIDLYHILHIYSVFACILVRSNGM